MTDNDPYILQLKREVETRYGAPLLTTNDFDLLRDDIIAATRETISLSTLKRFWGYVEGWQNPRRSTLDLLARYIGHASFKAFADRCSAMSGTESGFPESRTLHSADSPAGAIVELRWMPDRTVRLRHEGSGTYTVISSIGSKLREGWTLTAACFVSGEPLYASISGPATPEPRPYLAGKSHGITFAIVD